MGYDSSSLELGSLFFTIETATSIWRGFSKVVPFVLFDL